mmetsp:Transcript_25408/g.54653  ORF Transcript_25408/g.54653 Transcript_25408/m.54653 type:complete len:1087 (+) Transcript_25408:346-3606(+)|eukprot:CAMPEP_0172305992 /NCGR_PEP_ID=MMETSP1058-20130122/7171_1 /TAXON_ID=83371 /ORGANISM="Detonula confervacea, Strain CCMP 353" /LENGTH=1086 /DNA_ID=CAMNT_0013017761 /DNA_START=326 /DNA_END=3586 /DNA_ORIENTATION=+
MTRIRKQASQGGIQSLLLLLLSSAIPSTQSLSRGIAFPELIDSYATRTYDPANPQETCYIKLYESDVDGDGIVTNDEYTTFVAELSEGDYNVTNYVDLPFAIKVNFVYLNCLCQLNPEIARQEDRNCCEGPDGGIYVAGAGPEDTPTEVEDAYLQTVCGETQGAIEYVRNETVVVTGSPMVGPTGSPSVEPTESPTTLPSASPSNQPTQSPSPKPTTSTPTQSPSADPSKNPTDPPTLAPSTASPTASPTATPTTLPPSLSPNVTPTTGMPTTPEPTTGPVATPATDAPTAVPDTASPSQQPSTKAPISGTGAPTVFKEPTSEEPSPGITGDPTVTPSITVPTTAKPTFVQVPTTPRPTFIQVSTVPPTKAPTLGGTQYPSTSVQPSSIEAVIPPSTDSDRNVGAPGGDGGSQSESLSAGGVAGIIIASAVVVFAALYVYATKKRRREDDDPDLREVKNQDLDDLEAGRRAEGDDVPTQDKKDGNDPGSGGASALGIVAGGDESSPGEKGSEKSTPGEKSSSSEARPIYEARESYDAADYIPQSSDVPGSPPSDSNVPLISGVPPSPKRTGSFDDSSSAGESGWSSSAGMSSLNTASFDAGTDDGLLPGSPDRLLATIGAANIAAHVAGSTQRDAKPTFIPVNDQGPDERSVESHDINSPSRSVLDVHSDPSTPPGQGNVTREDLDAAIEAGDWAMVGATAALLADTGSTASDHSLTDLEKRSFQSKGSPEHSTHSARRAEELDRMVETGNWEGVVLAAAQFEGTSSVSRLHDRNSSYSSGSLSMARSKEKEVIRAEVDRLVRRVVPDEIDNIDEMMLQFAGREEELVETLRTMQERSVAQRARAAVQKTAKLEAKAKASISMAKYSGSLSSGLSHYAESANSSVSDYSHPSPGNSSISDSMTDSSVSDLGMTTDDYSSSRQTNQSSLELAIEKGDWRAVGEAAAMMGEVGSAIIPDESGDSSLSTSLSESLGKPKRVHHLDALISKGDWAGIVAVAGKYQALDDQMGDGGPPTEEEREALAQANMWQEIANQSKQDSSNKAQGALDAADWAISRSLEQKMKDADAPASSGDPDRKKSRIEDDESV